MRQCAWKIFKCILLRLCVQMVKCLLTTFMDPLFNGTQNTPPLKAEFALANAPSNLLGRWTLSVNILLTAALWTWQTGSAAGHFLKRPLLQKVWRWRFLCKRSKNVATKARVDSCVWVWGKFYRSKDALSLLRKLNGVLRRVWWEMLEFILKSLNFDCRLWHPGISEHIYWLDLFWFWNVRWDYVFSLQFYAFGWHFYPKWHCIQDQDSVHAFLGNWTHDMLFELNEH